MAYVSIGRISQAIDALKRFHPFFGVTFLSMKETGVNATAPIAWGSPQEESLLARYYKPEGAPQGKPYFVPLQGPEQDYGHWKNPKYSSGSLQRARTTDRFKNALVHPTSKTWAFTADYIQELKKFLPGATPEDRLPLNDFAAWFYRNELVTDLKELQQKFIDQFKLSKDELDALFDVQSENEATFFFDEPADADSLSLLVGGVPKGATFGGRGEDDLIKHLVEWVRNQSLMILPDGFVESVYYSLKTQPFVVLAGRPGTAKTSFARAYAAALTDFFSGAVSEIAVSIGKEFTEADVIGYEKISGELAATELTRRLFLDGRPRDIHFVILDEMNLSDVDSYLARLLPAIESGSQVTLPGAGEPIAVPTDTVVIGTINSFVEEPSRLPLSGPVKRRANIVEMPNHLATIVSSGDRPGFDAAAIALVKQSRSRAAGRIDSQIEGVFDRARVAGYDKALAPGGRSSDPEILTLLWEVCRVTDGSLTMGVLQDILDYVALSNESALTAIDRQIARKVLPQLGGSADPARALLELLTKHVSAKEFIESTAGLNSLLASEGPDGGVVIFKY